MSEIKTFKEVFEKKIKEAKELIKEVYQYDNIPWVIGYSGGKDSTATTQLVVETLIEMKKENINLNKKVYIISSDTLVENPMIINTIVKTINEIRNLANLELPIDATIVTPLYEKSFWTNLIGRGYPCPNQTFRWCTDRMKIEPANRFINSVVDQYGEAVMVLGVRGGESKSRDKVLKTHTIKGKKLMRHTTMPNAYVFAPIRSFTSDDVWNYLLQNESPWGGNNQDLYKLYADSSEDCPLIIDESTKEAAGSCGKSRFGCWVCTVVGKDKSLTGFISNGVKWLIPLLKYRNWLYNIRDKDEYRMKRRNNGSLYFTKIKKTTESEIELPNKNGKGKLTIKKINGKWVDSYNDEWNVFESLDAENEARHYIIKNRIDLDSGKNPKIIIKNVEGQFSKLGNGPFTFEFRKKMLKKLLETERDLETKYKLIKIEELNEIRKLWIKQGDWQDSVSKIYKETYNEDLEVVNDDVQMFDADEYEEIKKICDKQGFNFNTFLELVNIEKNYLGYIYRNETQKEIQKTLNKDILLMEVKEEKDET